jgi:hypothetical protein
MSLLQWFLIRDTGNGMAAIRGDPPARQISLCSSHEFPATSWRERYRIELLWRSRKC